MRSTSDSTLHDTPPNPGGAQASDAALWILCSADPSKVGQRVALDKREPLLLGRRVERGGVAIEDPKMSRVHARVAWDGRVAAYRIADDESANGTFLDGRRVNVGTLGSGSVVRIGDTVLVLIEGDPSVELADRLSRVAPAELSVLLLGESGTGKERAARYLHVQSGRPGAFVALNCATLPRDLLASELFGHARGAFSGADKERPGLFRAAHGGTLFLDEVGDLPLDFQPALLRVLQERRVRPVGSERELEVDVRVVAATQPSRVSRDELRLDLRARLAQVEVTLPPLRERPHELPRLVAELARDAGLRTISVSADAMEAFALADWLSNVRELQSLIARLKVFGSPPFVLDRSFLEREAPELLVTRTSELPAATTTAETEASITRQRLEALLAQHGGRASLVAKELGTSRTQIYRWLKRFGLSPGADRD